MTLGLMLVTTPVAASDLAYVTCQNGDALSVLDLSKGVQQHLWTVPGKPAGVAVGTNSAFTVAADSKTVRRHDPLTGKVLAQVVLDGGPIGVAHDPRRNRLCVSDW